MSADSKQIKATQYNDDAGAYYKKNDWSPYQLTGKIEKNAKYLGVGIAVAGTGSYYLDDFKLFVKEGKEKIEIPLKNSDFETDSLKGWQTSGLDPNTAISISETKAFSGKRSLFIDNSNVKVAPTLGNNLELGNIWMLAV